jgi:hypothetical protein
MITFAFAWYVYGLHFPYCLREMWNYRGVWLRFRELKFACCETRDLGEEYALHLQGCPIWLLLYCLLKADSQSFSNFALYCLILFERIVCKGIVRDVRRLHLHYNKVAFFFLSPLCSRNVAVVFFLLKLRIVQSLTWCHFHVVSARKTLINALC